MANRIVLNTISYHGAGAIAEIPGELQRRGYKKVFVCTDPDLVKFGVATKVTNLLMRPASPTASTPTSSPTPPSRTLPTASRPSRLPRPIPSSPSAAAPPWTPPRPSASSSPTPSLPTCARWRASLPPRTTPCSPSPCPPPRHRRGGHHQLRHHRRREGPQVRLRRHQRRPRGRRGRSQMMATMPAGLTASTGMDALTHAIEGYTTKGAWEMSDMFHLKAIELISKNLRDAVAEAKSGVPGSGREGIAPRPVHRRHGLLQRRPGRRPLHGPHPLRALRHPARRRLCHAAAHRHGVQQARRDRAPGPGSRRHGRRHHRYEHR